MGLGRGLVTLVDDGDLVRRSRRYKVRIQIEDKNCVERMKGVLKKQINGYKNG